MKELTRRCRPQGRMPFRFRKRCTQRAPKALAPSLRIAGESEGERKSPETPSWSSLTPRESEVIAWVLQGRLNKVIADLLGISIKTVEMHRKNAMRKLGVRSLLELLRSAIAHGRPLG